MNRHGDKIAVARESGWGDEYHYHLECESLSGLAGHKREFPLSELHPTRWHCYYCR